MTSPTTNEASERQSLLEVLTLLGSPHALAYDPSSAPSLQASALLLLSAHANDSPAASGLRFALAKAALRLDKEFISSVEAAGRLEAALAKAMLELVTLLAKRLPPTEGPASLTMSASAEHGPTYAELAYAELAHSLGSKGVELAQKVSANWTSKSAQAARGELPVLALWEPWLLDESAGQVRRYASLAIALWADVVRPLMERERQGKPLKVAVVKRFNQTYSKLPKLVPALSWAMGGDGIPARSVMVGMEKYVAEPTLISSATYVPKTWRLLSEQRSKRPHQTALPLDPHSSANTPMLDPTPTPPAAQPLPVAVTNTAGQVMSASASKLALLALSSEEVIAGKLAKAKLGELTRCIRPDLSRIQGRDHEATARGLDELRNLFLFLPDGSRVQLFDVTSPANPAKTDPELEVCYGVTKSLEYALRRAADGEFGGPQLTGHEYRGAFLMNLSGAMRLPNNQPSLLRYYIRLTATWNAAFSEKSGAFDEGKLKAMGLEEWAALANSLQPSVVEYLSADEDEKRNLQNRRFALRDERKRAREDLEALAEEHGLIRLEGKGNLVRPLPPLDYLEAWETFRQQGGRPASPFSDDE